MEVLNEPMVDYVSEMRIFVEKFMNNLAMKMVALFVQYAQQGYITDLELDKGYRPKSLNITVDWQPVFPMTTDDLQQMVNLYTSMTNANIISRETALQKLSQHFDIDDIQEELRKVNTQHNLTLLGFNDKVYF